MNSNNKKYPRTTSGSHHRVDQHREFIMSLIYGMVVGICFFPAQLVMYDGAPPVDWKSIYICCGTIATVSIIKVILALSFIILGIAIASRLKISLGLHMATTGIVVGFLLAILSLSFKFWLQI